MNEDYMQFYAGKRVLVTGGTGSIGRRVAEALTRARAEVTVLSRDEAKQVELRDHSSGRLIRRTVLGDVRRYQSVVEACAGQQVVFHCAALKHVDLCEENVFEAVQTNVLGTQNVREAALNAGVGRLVFLSTDKAAAPHGVMGMTKALAERLLLQSEMQNCAPVVVRFGNVVGSRGSVFNRWLEAKLRGEPIKLTDPAMVRYLMTPAEAAELVLWAGAEATPYSIVVKAMRAARLDTLADAVVGSRWPRQVVGLRPGEKFVECLLAKEELESTEILTSGVGTLGLVHRDGFRANLVGHVRMTFAPTNFMDAEELREMLRRAGILP